LAVWGGRWAIDGGEGNRNRINPAADWGGEEEEVRRRRKKKKKKEEEEARLGGWGGRERKEWGAAQDDADTRCDASTPFYPSASTRLLN
jgi:hypothetical protein